MIRDFIRREQLGNVKSPMLFFLQTAAQLAMSYLK